MQILSIFVGHLDVVQLLLDNRVDVNAKNNYGNGPIHLASDAGKLNFRTENNFFSSKNKIFAEIRISECRF